MGLAALTVQPGSVVLVLPGDMPLVSASTIGQVVARHLRERPAATVLTAIPDVTPVGFGRVLRDDAGQVVGIVEQRDASPEQLAVREVNTSVYAFDGVLLQAALGELAPDNDQGELYLTDVIHILVRSGHRVAAHVLDDPAEAAGINTVAQRDEVSELLAQRFG